jgi:cytidylate kinase
MKIVRIAIDGPSGAGKSTVAKALAIKLGIDYIDTGAMYRAVGYKMIQQGIGLSEIARLQAMLAQTEIDFSAGNILLDGEVINDRIRTQEIAKMASDCSALAEVRGKLVELQRKMGQVKSVAMDGRDIGTNVLKDAEYKFYITATAEERAHRRWLELVAKGEQVTLDSVLTEMIQRDINDSTRALNPLRKAEDAVEIDSTNKTAEETTAEALSYIK